MRCLCLVILLSFMSSKFTFVYGGVLVLALLFMNVIGGPTGNFTDAIGDSSSACSGCHSGSYHATTVELVGAPSSIEVSQTYDFKFRISSVANPVDFKGGGFQLLATYLGQNSMVGSFSPIDAGTKVNISGNQRLVHNAPRAKTGNAVEWDVRWTAPTELSGPVTFYYAGNAVNLDGSSGGGDVVKLGSTVIALPVTFSRVAAYAEADRIIVDWATATEINNDYFLVERSSDGRSFEAIGQVYGAGDSDYEQTYRFEDETPRMGRTNYYRLRQVDYDGTESYSEVVQVTLGAGSGQWSVGPNPAVPGETLRFTGAYPQRLQVFAADGQLVRPFSITGGTWTLDGQLPAGVYYLADPVGGRSQRLLVQ